MKKENKPDVETTSGLYFFITANHIVKLVFVTQLISCFFD